MLKIPDMKSNSQAEEQLLKEIAKRQAELKSIPIESLIQNAGLQKQQDHLTIEVFFTKYLIDPNSFEVTELDGSYVYPILKNLILSYLTIADGTDESGELISFRELPNGENYCQAFQGYAPDRLAKHFKFDSDKLLKSCKKIGGNTVDIGDVGFVFQVLPRVNTTMVYYLGDETFSSSASLLFDKSITHYILTTGVASLGYQIVEIIIRNS